MPEVARIIVHLAWLVFACMVACMDGAEMQCFCMQCILVIIWCSVYAMCPYDDLVLYMEGVLIILSTCRNPNYR